METGKIKDVETPRNHKEKIEYKKELQYYEKMLSRLNAIVFVFDVINLRMVWINDAMKRILGYDKPDVNIDKQSILDIYHPDDRDVLKEMRNYFRHRKSGTFTAVYKFRDVNGEYLWLCTAANIFRRTTDESVFEVVGVTLDMTHQLVYKNNVKVLSREMMQQINKSSIEKITKREKEILRYFANGYKTREIAEMLQLSFHTVNNHRKNLLKKLKMKNLAALVSFAVESGLD